MTTTTPPPVLGDETPPPPRSSGRWWTRYLPLLLVLLSLGLAVQGQRLFNEIKPDPPLSAMLFFGAATLCFVLATALASPIPLFGRTAPTTPSEGTDDSPPTGGGLLAMLPAEIPWVRVLGGAAAVVLLGGLLYDLAQVPRIPQLPSYTAHFWRWLIAIVLMTVAFIPDFNIRAFGVRVRVAIAAHRLELLILLGIMLLGGVLRLWGLGATPAHLNGDEASIGMDLQKILSGEIRDPFGLIWGPLPALSGFVMAGFYSLLGENIAALRFPGALAGALAVGAVYALGRGFMRRETALGAALLLATLPLHIHYSRIAVNVSWDTFFFTAALAALYWAIERKGGNTTLFLLAGMFAGFGQYAYSGSRLIPLIILGVLGIYALFFRARLRDKWRGIIGMACIFMVIAAPLYLYAVRFPDDFNARLNQTGIFQTGFVEQQKALRNTDTLGVLIDQVRLTLFGFAFVNDNTETWGAFKPLVPILMSLGLFVGLVLSLRRWRSPSTAMLHGWFWGVVIAGGALTINAPTSNRLVSALPVVCLFAALGWDMIAAAITPDNPNTAFRVRAHQTAIAIFAIGIALLNLNAYQDYVKTNNYGGLNAKIATAMGRDLARRPTGTTLIALTAPTLYANMSPIAFLTPGYTRRDYNEPLATLPPDLPSGDLLIIAIPNRVGELGVFQQQFTGSSITEVLDPQTNQLLYYALWVDQ